MTIVGGLRARLIRESLFEMLNESLDALEWFDTSRPHEPVTFVSDPYDQEDPIPFNSASLSDEVAQIPDDLELGSNLTEDRWIFYVDIYAQNDALGLHFIRDIRDILMGKMPSIDRLDPSFDVWDYTQATPSVEFRCQIEDVAIDRAHGFTKPWMQHWYSAQFVVVDSYYTEDTDEDTGGDGGGGDDVFPPTEDLVFEQVPYGADSPWNLTLDEIYPDGVPLRSGQSALIDLIKDGTYTSLTSDPTQFTMPVYVVDSSTATSVVAPTDTWRYGDDDAVNGSYQAGELLNVPVPSGVKPATGSDAQVIILDVENGVEWNFYDCEVDVNGFWAQEGGRYICRNAGRYDALEDGTAVPATTPKSWTLRGAGVPYLTGLIRKWEIDAGVINHAIAFAFNSPAPEYVYPASKSDGQGGAGEIPEGARLRLRQDFDVSTLDTEAAQTIAQALKDYGMIVIDHSGRPKVYAEFEYTADWDGLVETNTLIEVLLDDLEVIDWDYIPPSPTELQRWGTNQTAAATTGTETSVVITRPVALNEGDLEIIAINLQPGTGTPVTSAPSGWALLTSVNGGANTKTYLFWRRREASNPATETFTITGGTASYGAVAVGYAGAKASGTPFGTPSTQAISSNTTTFTVPAITPTVAGSILLTVCGINSNATTFTVLPSGYTTNAEIGGKRVNVADDPTSSVGVSTGALSYTTSANAQGGTIHVEILTES